MQITEFNFIIDFFQRGVVHILKRCLAWYIKVRKGKKKATNPNNKTRLHFSFPVQSPKQTHSKAHTLLQNVSLKEYPYAVGCCSVSLQTSQGHRQIPGCSSAPATSRWENKGHRQEGRCSLSPSLFQLKNTRCSNPKLSCLQESLFDCRCFIFLFHHTSHSWPCAIIACFSLKSSLCCYLHSGLCSFDHWAICNKRLPR